MLIRQHTQRVSRERLAETLVVPADPAELNTMLTMVRERLLHPQTVVQVYADTLFLNSLTREQLAEEKVIPLAYAQRRLAVFELGILAMLRCSAFASAATRYVFEKLDRERATWDDRVWEIRAEEGELSGERRHYPLGFSNQKR
jgi:hypothetical protein